MGGDETTRRSSFAAWLAFGLVPVLYAGYQLMTNGREILAGGMWAELALTYYPAHDLPLVQQLLAGDAGYLPLPQRLLSLPLSLLDVSASAYPYYYFVVATAGAGLLVATLCLPTFRTLIPSDGLRFVLAVSLLVVADVNTRAFTNFVYFAVVPLIAVTALALANTRPVPGWAWILPLFMISKLSLLAAVPVMVLVAVVRSGRFRAITLASVACAAAQLFYVSKQNAPLVDVTAPGYLAHIAPLVLRYVPGFLGRWTTAPVSPGAGWVMSLAGVTLVVGVVVLVVKARGSALALVVVALSYAALNIVVNAPVIDVVGVGANAVVGPIVEMRDRLYIGAILGIVLMVGGLIAAARQLALPRLPGRRSIERVSAVVAIGVFVAWFGVTGWSDRAQAVAVQQGLPRMGTSQFERLAGVLDRPEARVCVPVDGGWILGRGCTALVGTPIPDPNDVVLHGFRPLPRGRGLVLDAPDPVRSGSAGLSSVAIMMRPADASTKVVAAHALLTMTDGSTIRWAARASVAESGGLVQLSNVGFEPLPDVERVVVTFDRRVDLALTTSSWQPHEGMQVLWMGAPADAGSSR